MILLAAIVLAVVVGLLCGGHLGNLGRIKLRYSFLLPVALLLQILIFSPSWQARLSPGLSNALYASSMVMLLPLIWLNRRLPGIPLVGLGLLSNAAVILANGGHMPASLDALRMAGIVAPNATFEAVRVTNSSLADAFTPLWFLGDIFAMPESFPLANVYSIGDVLLGLGAVWFVWAHMYALAGHEADPQNRSVKGGIA